LLFVVCLVRVCSFLFLYSSVMSLFSASHTEVLSDFSVPHGTFSEIQKDFFLKKRGENVHTQI